LAVGQEGKNKKELEEALSALSVEEQELKKQEEEFKNKEKVLIVNYVSFTYLLIFTETCLYCLSICYLLIKTILEDYCTQVLYSILFRIKPFYRYSWLYYQLIC